MKKYLLILLLILSIVIVKADIDSGLVLYLPFNNSITDYSPLNLTSSYFVTGNYVDVDTVTAHGYDFALKQNSKDVYWITGGFDGTDTNMIYGSEGAIFDTTGYINFTTNLHQTNNGTVIIRFKLNNSDMSQRQKIFLTGKNFQPAIQLQMLESTGLLTVYADNASAAGSLGIVDAASIAEEWHTVAINWNTSGVYVYYDNVYNGSIAVTGGNFSDGEAFYAGIYGDSLVQPLNGTISSLLIFNQEITDNERTNYYNQGNYTINRNNIINESITFDGKPFTTVIVENSSKLDYTTENFTVAFWFNLNSTGLATSQRLVSKAEYNSPTNKSGYELFYLKSDASLRFRVQNDTVTTDATTGANTINLNTWYFVTARKENDNMSIFIDGVYNASNSFPGNIKSSIYPLQVGNIHISYLGGRNSPTNGTIDDVRIYNRSLTDADILQLYNLEGSAVGTQVNNLTIVSNTSNSAYIVFNYTNSSTTTANIYVNGVLNNTNTYPDIDYNITDLGYGINNITVKAVYNGSENDTVSSENSVLFQVNRTAPSITLISPDNENNIMNAVNFSFTPICYTENCSVEIYVDSTDYNYTTPMTRLNNGDRVIDLGTGNEWDNVTVYAAAPYYNGSHYFVFYAGGHDITKPKTQYDIGLAIGTSLTNLTKYAGNPIYNASNDSNTGIVPSQIMKIGSTYYMYSYRYNPVGSTDYMNITLMNSTDLFNWNSPVDIITRDDYNLGPSVRIDSYNTSQLIMYYVYFNYSFSPAIIKIGKAIGGTTTNPYSFTISDTNPMISEDEAENETTNYPLVRYRNYRYYLTYMSKNTTPTTLLSMSNSTNLYNDSNFLGGEIFFSPSIDGWDNYYVTKRTFINDDTNGIEYMLYTGRNVSTTPTRYIGIGLAQRNYTIVRTWESRKVIVNVTNNTVNSFLFNVSSDSDVWNARIIQNDGQAVFAENNNTILTQNISISTNLTTDTIFWPNLNFSINVSLTAGWNQTPVCSIVDNVNWLNCTPATQTINLADNYTTFVCQAYERNSGSVNLYANCSSVDNLYINSTTIAKIIYADSFADMTTNLTGTIYDYILSGFDILISELNWTEQADCAVIFNDTGVICNNTQINDGQNGTISCTPDYVQTKDYSVSVNCNGTLYTNINSTVNSTFTLDADSNPDMTTNISRTYNNIVTDSFDVNLLGINWFEIPSCALVWNDSGVTCNGITLNSTGNVTGATYSGNLTCLPDYQQIKTYNVSANCNGTLYSNINSTISYLVTLNDTIPPYFTNNSDNSTSLTPEFGGSIQLNLTINDAYNVSSCRLMLNETGTWENKSIYNLNTRFQYNLSMNYTLIGIKSYVGWRVWCNDSLGNANVSDIYTFSIKDFTKPILTLGTNNGFNTVNTTVVSSALYNISYNVSFVDPRLFEAEVNVTCGLSGQVYYWKQLDWNYTTLNKTDTINLTNLPPQRCTFFAQASDDHTANIIEKYRTKDLEDGIDFTTENNINIIIKTIDDTQDFKKVDIVKEKDRYTFEFSYKKKKLDRSFNIISDKNLYYRPNSNYNGHFVAWNDETHSGNWIDFETDDNFKYTVKRINKNEYNVKMEPIIDKADNNLIDVKLIQKYGKTNIKFRSVGGTNIGNLSYYFFIGGVINVSAFNIYDNTSIQDYNLSISSVTAYPGLNRSYNITTHNILIENISNGTYKFLFNRTNFFNLTYNVNVSNVTQWLNYSAFQAVVNIIVQDIKTGTILSGNNLTWLNLNNSPYNNTYINTTTRTIFYINASNYSLNINGTNYDIYNNNYTINALENRTITVDFNPFLTFYLYDEKTLDLFNYTSPSSISFLLICSDTTTTTTINGTSVPIIPITCNYTSFRFILEWLPGETISGATSYFRSYLFDTELKEQNIFLIDLATTEEVSNNIILDDLLQDYDSTSIFIKKNIGDEQVQITADYTDIENKIVATLIKNNEYIIEVHSTNNPDRVMGTYIANTNNDKTIRLYDINLDPSTGNFAGNLTYNLWMTNTSGDLFVRGWVQDLSNITTNSTFTVRESTYNGTILYSASSTSNNVTWEYNISSNLNRTIFTTITIDRTGGNVLYTRLMHESNRLVLGIMNYYGMTFMNWFFTLFLGVLAIMATIRTANYVSIAFVGLASLFVIFGWYGISNGILALSLLVSITGLIKAGDKGPGPVY